MSVEGRGEVENPNHNEWGNGDYRILTNRTFAMMLEFKAEVFPSTVPSFFGQVMCKPSNRKAA